MVAHNKIYTIKATGDIRRGDPIFIDSTNSDIYVSKEGLPIGIALEPTNTKVSYIDWYAHKLTEQTMPFTFKIFDMAKQLDHILCKYNYENVIKKCLILKQLGNIGRTSDYWRYTRTLAMSDKCNNDLNSCLRKYKRKRLFNKFKIWRDLS